MVKQNMHETRILNKFTDLHLCLENYAQNMQLHIRGYYSSYSLKRRLSFSVVF